MDKLYCLWLVLAFGAGNPLITELLTRFGSAHEVYRAFQENRALAGREAAEKAASVSEEQAAALLETLKDRGIFVLPISGLFYPEPLKQIENPPCVLFVRGNYRLLSGRLLSTAGSRDITNYTMAAQEKLCARLCRRYTLVSTLSHGCDELSCLCAIKNRCACAEILPCGFDHEYPQGSRVLREQILRCGGCIVTEFLPETKPSFSSFRRRARIVGGISRALLIFQAGTQSGALTAAEYAGKVFFLPPHNIFAKEYAGTAAFVRAGAGLLLDERDLSPVYIGKYRPERLTLPKNTRKPAAEVKKAPPKEEPSAEQFDSQLHYRVYKMIADSTEPPLFDRIFDDMSCGISELNEILLDLELSDHIRPIAGGRYSVV